MMKKILSGVTFFALIISISACQQQSGQGETRRNQPNIIYILTDDLGYGDLGVLYQNQRAEKGQPHHKTPNLDVLANEGMTLTRHYTPAPVCAPSRASLLLGVHQGHANIRNNQFDKALADNHTMATVLKEAGYTTGLIGKYGLQGKEGDSPETWEAYPTKRGFDHFFGYVRHRDGHNHYPFHEGPERPPVELYHGNKEISGGLEGAYTTDLFTAAAKNWITERKQSGSGNPFFLYLAYDTPHAGLQVAPSPYPGGGGLGGGVQWIGNEGNFINTVDESIDDYIHPDYRDKDWPSQQKRFASMVRRIDNAIGDIRKLLKDLNIDDNTMIVFSSDNGPHRESYGYGEYNPTLFDSFGLLDGIKRDTWEGGIRMPTLVRWPGHVPAGSSDDTPSQFHDWLPTFADLAGIPAPARTDGVSLVPMLTGNGNQQPGQVYIEYAQGRKTPDYEEFHPTHRGQLREQMQVIYLDGYKGVRYNIQSAEDDFRIYDTREDPGETKNLADSSEYFQKLQQQMKNQVLRMRVTNASAIRPYDSLPVPALAEPGNGNKGLRYKVFETATPWTPAIASLDQEPAEEGNTGSFDLRVKTRDDNFVVEYSGLIHAPETGKYTFSLQIDRGAVFRIHDATVIDADKMYTGGSQKSGTIYLEQGFHPVNLVYARNEAGEPFLDLTWQGPGFEEKEVEAGSLKYIQ